MAKQYFAHDVHARHDPKIVAMRSTHGYEGYGWFWAIVETMRENPHYRIPLNKCQVLALCKELEINPDTLKRFIEDCIEMGLFENISGGDEIVIHAPALTKRMLHVDSIIDTKRAAGIASGKARKLLADKKNEQPLNICSSHGEQLNKIKSNKTKEKERRIKNPTIDEVENYCKEKHYTIDVNHFWEYNESRSWTTKSGPIKNWKLAVATWARNEKAWHKGEKTYVDDCTTAAVQVDKFERLKKAQEESEKAINHKSLLEEVKNKVLQK